MSTTTATPSAADQAAAERMQKCFDALDKIAASQQQIASRKSEAERQFLDTLLSGNFEGPAVLRDLNSWKQQNAALDDQANALKEVENHIQQFLKRQFEDRSPALKQVLLKEESRLREQIGKSTDQAAALQKRLDEITAWLAKMDAGAAQQPAPKKGGVAASA
jgi:hypothetical protein